MAVQQTRQESRIGSVKHSGNGTSALSRGAAPYDGDGQNGGSNSRDEQLARALGWFSVGLGLAQIVVPRELAQLIGVPDNDDTCAVMRAVGLREIVSGVGILTQPDPTPWLWARVGGDAMDIALLTAALNSNKAQQDRVALALAAVAGITALDVRCSTRLNQHSGGSTTQAEESKKMDIKKAITVNRPPEELYQFWHDFENLPRFMNHLESVQVTGDGRSHWKAKAPAGTTVEWDAEIIDDQPNQRIAWRSLEGADVDNAGSVSFKPAPGGRGTEVRVEMRYNPPAGIIGATIAKLFGEAPEQQVYDDLRAFKQVIETGEVVQSDASVHRHMHPAQPPEAKS